MAIPILAAVGAKVALPIVGKLLGGTALKGLLGGLLGKAGLGSLLGSITKFLPMATNIMKGLGNLGLSGMKSPMGMGRLPGLGYMPPGLGGTPRPGGLLGGEAGIQKLLGGMQDLLGGGGTGLPTQLQGQLGAMRDMVQLLSNMQRQVQDVMMQTLGSLRG